MKKILLIFFSLLPACSWFGKEKEATPIIRQDHVIESFDELKIAGDFIVKLIKSGHEKVVIETQEDVMPFVGVQVEGDELNLYLTDAAIQLATPIAIDVYYKNITEIDIAGSVILNAGHLHAQQLDISASGASQITAIIETDRLEIEGYGTSKFTLSGTAKKQKIDLSGAVVYNAVDLKSGEADLIVSGSTRSTLHVTKKIVGELSGTASVNYKGSAKVDVNHTEDASITKVG